MFQYIDPDLRALFALAQKHDSVFIWDGDPHKLYSVDMDRLQNSVAEEDLDRFAHLVGGAMIRLPVIDRTFWAPSGHYAGYKGEQLTPPEPEPKRDWYANYRGKSLDRKALDFFNSLSGVIQFPLDKTVKKTTLLFRTLDSNDGLRSLTSAEKKRLILKETSIKLRVGLKYLGKVPDPMTFPAPTLKGFTVEDLRKAIIETERHQRPLTNWFNGPDTHHCFFEGIYPSKDGVWVIQWGS